jgi:hypothetical protein
LRTRKWRSWSKDTQSKRVTIEMCK